MRVMAAILALALAIPFAPSAAAIESGGGFRERRQTEARAALEKGIVFIKENKFDEAIKEFSKALESESALNKENRELAKYLRGLAQFNKGDCLAAMADFDHLAESRAGDSKYHFVRAVCLEKSGDSIGGAASLDRAIELSPNAVEFIRVRCINRINTKDFGNAIPDCERVVALKPDDADIWLAIGQSSELSNQKDKALNAYRKLLTLKPDSKPAQDGIKRLGG